MSATKLRTSGTLNLSNGSNDATILSPMNANMLNVSMGNKNLSLRRSFSPMGLKNMKTPEISPINQVKRFQGSSGGKENESPSMNFLRRRNPRLDMEERKAIAFRAKRKKRYTVYTLSATPVNLNTPSPNKLSTSFNANNSHLEKRMSVKTILQDLKLSQHESIFINEEIDLKVFFTLNDIDLLSIGISTEEDRKKILKCIEEMNKKTPTSKISSVKSN